MKLTVILDNSTYIDEYYLGEPGVCYFIEDQGTKILLDVGYSGVFMKNAEKMGIDLDQVDILVLSHGHNDHAGGMKDFFEGKNRKKMNLVTHPCALERKFYEGEEIGAPYSREELAVKCRLVQTETPLKLTNNMTFLGEIPRDVEFEPIHAIGETQVGEGQRAPDYLRDDSALVYKGERGIYIITGCSHSGICNIVEHAKAVTGEERVLGIIGGFHLFDAESEKARGAVEYLKEQQVAELYPCHCTSFGVRAAIHRETPVREVGVGLTLEWN